MARPLGAGAQGAAVRVSASALRQAGTAIATDVEAEPARPGAGAEGRRLRGVRIGGDTLLPGPEVSAAADFWAQSGRSRGHHAGDLRVSGLCRAFGAEYRHHR